jgi:hypothetical protein
MVLFYFFIFTSIFIKHNSVGVYQVRLAADPSFPVSLIGSVALKVVMTQVKPVFSSQDLRYDVFTSELVKVHKNNGYSMEFVTQAFDRQKLVWEAYFSFYKKLSSPLKDSKVEDLTPVPIDPSYESYELLLSLKVPQDAGLALSRINADYNPVHVSKIGAKLFGFKTMIAHG